MSGLTFQHLREVNEARGVEWHGGSLESWTVLEWAGALCGEAGELANVAKKIKRIEDGVRSRDNEKDVDELRVKLGAECADVLLYTDLVAARCGIDLEAAVVAKFNSTSEKFGFAQRLLTAEAPSDTEVAILNLLGVVMMQGTSAELDVLTERQKQREKWGDKHDDGHQYGSLRVVAAILSVNGTDACVVDPLDRVADDVVGRGGQHDHWGLSRKHDERQRLVIAAALLLAEIERLDRLSSGGVEASVTTESPATVSTAGLDVARPWFHIGPWQAWGPNGKHLALTWNGYPIALIVEGPLPPCTNCGAIMRPYTVNPAVMLVCTDCGARLPSTFADEPSGSHCLVLNLGQVVERAQGSLEGLQKFTVDRIHKAGVFHVVEKAGA